MATLTRTSSLLEKLKLQETNPGACHGPDGWISDPAGKPLVSKNPTTGEPIATVVQATPEAYETVVGAAARAFESWRMVPAPKRGELVRDLGNALRELKEPLGDLVSLEMGKIRAEGHDCHAFVHGARRLSAPWGLFGGREGGNCRIVYSPGVEPPVRAQGFLRPGQSVTIVTPGAGGYGDPRRRDPALVRRDLAEGIISEEVARDVYGWRGA